MTDLESFTAMLDNQSGESRSLNNVSDYVVQPFSNGYKVGLPVNNIEFIFNSQGQFF